MGLQFAMADYCERNNIRPGSEEFKRLVKYEDPSFLHPWYGPCDSIGNNRTCAECQSIIDYLTFTQNEYKYHFYLHGDNPNNLGIVTR